VTNLAEKKDNSKVFSMAAQMAVSMDHLLVALWGYQLAVMLADLWVQ
jgi:hypothetical protein